MSPVGQQVRVERALRQQLRHLAGGHGEMIEHSTRSWASITFSGARHTIALAFEGAEAVEGGEVLIAELAEHEFAVPGQLVADAKVISTNQRADPPRLEVEAEILLLEDAPPVPKPAPAPAPPVPAAPQRRGAWRRAFDRTDRRVAETPIGREIEDFLRLTGLAPTKFGRLATADPRFVLDLRQGRMPRAPTVERVRHFMANYEVGA